MKRANRLAIVKYSLRCSTTRMTTKAGIIQTANQNPLLGAFPAPSNGIVARPKKTPANTAAQAARSNSLTPLL